jgi:peptidyl-tRNA hydrolase
MKRQFGTDFLQNSFQNSLQTADSCLEFYLQNRNERFDEKFNHWQKTTEYCLVLKGQLPELISSHRTFTDLEQHSVLLLDDHAKFKILYFLGSC